MVQPLSSLVEFLVMKDPAGFGVIGYRVGIVGDQVMVGDGSLVTE